MSGTSFDGTDLALVRIPGLAPAASAEPPPLELVASDFLPYPEHILNELIQCRQRCAAEKDPDFTPLGEELGFHYADRIRELLARAGREAGEIRAAGLHGQTVWHSPPLSVQLGCPRAVARELEMTVVADIRQADLGLGGEGAPIMPALHRHLWGGFPGTTVVVNLGGIANVSVIDSHRLLYGFDTGPANTLIDLWVRRHWSKPCDEDGELARQGRVDEGLLGRMRGYEWFARLPPKSTDQKYFNGAWLDRQLKGYEHMEKLDVLATLTALSARSIGDALRLIGIDGCDRLILCGGGGHNRALVEFVKREIKCGEASLADDQAYPSDYLEAIGIAWMAERALAREPLGINHITGAREDCVFGQIYRAGGG